MRPVRVAVHAADPITQAGLVSCLGLRSEFELVGGEHGGRPDVAVVQIARSNPGAAARLRELHAAAPAPKVLVGNGLQSADVLTAVECRVVALLSRAEAAGDRLAAAVLAAASGRGALPPELVGELLARVRRLAEDVLAPRGLTAASLTKREVDVLRLLADGRDTADIAEALCYTERTVKKVIHAMTTRLHLRNRPHAVAYAVRAGVI
jgi:DNA-binding NarL/FixJ family response regulator